jgi:hypothetical protein
MMTYPHRIRLRGPWELGDGLPKRRRVIMPSTWAAAGLAGYPLPARFIRKFGYPGQIDEHERVWLICEELSAAAEISLNGQVVASNHTGAFAFDVTALLAKRNRLEIVLHADDDQAPLWDEVALEIRRTAYLADMRATPRRDAALEISGRVVGGADRPLEVYVLADGNHVHYQTIDATAAGAWLHVEIPPRDVPVQRVRVELVNVATVWYAWEATIAGHRMRSNKN